MNPAHSARRYTGYTSRVKTAVSVPDPVFHEAERIARSLGWSRSQLYTQAIRELIARQEDDPVTAALDALADEDGTDGAGGAGGAGLAAGRALIRSGDWQW